ncbi:MAG: Co2+/Mg2+ efflux protein ApaG [Beijerinckiaceae bacterium]
MYKAVTRDVSVSVEPEYLAERSAPGDDQYFWAYTVEIENHGSRAVQLKRRHWIITDGRGHREEVRGPGVVGEEPIIEPGECFRYASGCPLTTPDGFMVGSYDMIADNGEAFSVEIPAFSLHLPGQRRVLN